ncbi:Cytochrome p450 [Globisporangium polare]
MHVVLSPASVLCALLAVSITALALPLVREYRRKARIAKGLSPIPGPKGWPLLGILPDLLSNAHRINDRLEELMQEHGGRVLLPGSIFSEAMVFLASPEDVQHMLATKHDNYVRAERFIDTVGPVFKQSFLGLNHAHTSNANSALLRLQRKMVTKVFNAGNFRTFTEQVFHKYAVEMVELVKRQGGRCNMHDVSTEYALLAIFDISCGVPLQDVDEKIGKKFVAAMDYVFSYLADRLLTKPYFKYFWWCMPSEYEMRRSERTMMALADDILGRRVKESDEEINKRSDLMSLFIKKARELSEDEDQESSGLLDTETLRSIFLTFLFAGKDPTSSAITYALYALCLYPEVQQKVLDELLQQAAKSKSNVLSYDEVKGLAYLDAVVNETLRLYPTLPSNFKVAAEDDVLPDGTFIPAGAELAYSPWHMGRNNAIFGSGDLLEFRPERWLEMKTRPSAHDFPVFQAGPRICIGMNLAMIEVKVFIAVMVREFHVAIQEGEKVKDRGYLLSPTLIMDGGLPLQMTPRKATAVPAQ